jgi:hypothetical protein
MYAVWLAAVSSETTVLDAHPIANLDKFNYAHETFTTGYPWSGLELSGGEQYVLVNADIQVPTIYPQFPWYSQASIWAGLGGDGDQALIQAGVEFDYTEFEGSSLQSWIEYWTLNVQNVNLPVSSGDQLFVSCWPSEASGARDPNGGYGAFYMKNTTTGNAIGVTVVQAPHTYHGNTAEWIVEVHSEALTNYGTAYAQGSGYDNSGGTHNFDTDPFNSISLWSHSNDTLMSYAAPYSGNGTVFYWYGTGP